MGAPTSTGSRRFDWVTWARRAFVLGGWFVLIVIGTFFLRRDAFKYLEWSETVYLRFWQDRILLATHVATAGVGLVLGPLQFWTWLRNKKPVLHRSVGWIYVLCALSTAPMTVALSFHSCAMCRPPFLIWSTLFGLVTLFGVAMAVQRNFTAHRQFMIRSYVLMLGFVFVRLDVHIPYPLPVGPEVHRPSLVLWVAWVVPLLVTELWISWIPSMRKRRSKGRRSVLEAGS